MRILSPDDFGIVAKLIIILTAFNVFLDLGYSQAIIQQKDSTRQSLSSHFILGSFIGLILGSILFISKSYIASYFEQTELIFPLSLFSITLFIGGTILVHRSILYKEMEFKKLAIIDLSSILLSGIIALYLALNGWGFMAIVYQLFFNSIIQAILYWIISSFKPMLIFKISDVKRTSSFSSYIFFSEIVNYISNILDQFLAALYFNNTVLGLYNRSISLIKNPANIIPSTNEAVLFPLFSRLNNNNEGTQHDIFNRTISMVAFIFTPLLFIYYFFAEDFVLLILGKSWIEIIPYTKILSLLAVLLVTKFGGSLLMSKAKVKEVFFLNLLNKGIIILSILIGIRFGMMSVLWSLLIAEGLKRIINLIAHNRLLNFDIIQYVQHLYLPLIYGFLLAIFLLILQDYLPSSNWNIPIILITYCIYVIGFTYFSKNTFAKDTKMILTSLKHSVL